MNGDREELLSIASPLDGSEQSRTQFSTRTKNGLNTLPTASRSSARESRTTWMEPSCSSPQMQVHTLRDKRCLLMAAYPLEQLEPQLSEMKMDTNQGLGLLSFRRHHQSLQHRLISGSSVRQAQSIAWNVRSIIGTTFEAASRRNCIRMPQQVHWCGRNRHREEFIGKLE